MEYSKPEIVVLAEASIAIQGVKSHGAIDRMDPLQPRTTAAYESDE